MIDELKPYSAYKDSGLPWGGVLPSHWKVERAKGRFEKLNRPIRPEDETVTCFRDGTVTLRKNRRLRGFTEAIYELGYQGIRKGDLVIHAMDAFAGAVGVSDSDGKGSPIYGVCRPKFDDSAYYYALVVREMSRSQWILALSRGIRERSTDFRFESFARQFVPVPPLDEQAAIVKFLDYANGKIERAIRAKRKQLLLVRELLVATTQAAMQSSEAQKLLLSQVVNISCRRVNRDVNKEYIPIGLFNRGRGLFHKPQVVGSALGDSEFFWIEEDDLIISGQFAWEGAVALASALDSNCIASHRFPILQGRIDVVSSAVLFAIFRTSYGQLLLDVNSRGAAGRNRPLNLRSLLRESIPVPSLDQQKLIEFLVSNEREIIQSTEMQVKYLKELRTKLTAEVVTGKLDVREAAKRLPDQADEPLPADDSVEDLVDDEIAEEIEA